VTVFIPEYVVGRWWEHLLHNPSALRLKARLLFTPGVMVVSVPWQLQSSAEAARRDDRRDDRQTDQAQLLRGETGPIIAHPAGLVDAEARAGRDGSAG
jgi:hypothetical protein